MNEKDKNSTSIKELIQFMNQEDASLVLGVVVGDQPVSVQIINNPKMIVSGANLTVPKHLTNYTTKVSINLCSAPILAGKATLENEHSHVLPSGENTEKAEAHIHDLEEFSLAFASATIHNGLAVGEVVNLLRLNGGKQYYVLDRMVSV